MDDLILGTNVLSAEANKPFSDDPDYIGSFCREYNLVHQFRDNAGGIREIEIEMSLKCSATYGVKREKAVEKMEALISKLNTNNIVSKNEAKEIRNILHAFKEFVTYTPKVEETLEGVYVNYFYNRKKLTFLQTLVYRLTGRIPYYNPTAISNKVYSKLELLWVTRDENKNN